MSLTARLRLTLPVLQAPMAGGATTPALAAAVAGAGGLGSLGCAYLSPEEIAAAAAATRALCGGQFGLNLFAGGQEPWDGQESAAAALAVVAEAAERLGIPVPPLPVPPAEDPFRAQAAAVLAARPALFSVTFGRMPPDLVAEAKAAGILTMATATSLAEAEILAEDGVEAVMLQGAEAGGHRGSFLSGFPLHPIRTLLPEVRARLPEMPLVASGGLMTGAEIAEMLDLGAEAVALGTAFLACPEAGTGRAWTRALLQAAEGAGDRAARTALTRAYSGRPARGLPNRFWQALEASGAILPYPYQNALTRPLRRASAAADDPEHLSLWCGTGVSRIRAMPAAALMAALAAEIRAARGSGPALAKAEGG